MKIAQVAPLYESVPRKLYGGTEWVVSLGKNARLVAPCARALRVDAPVTEPLAHHYNI